MELTSLLIFAGALLVAAGRPARRSPRSSRASSRRAFATCFPFLAAMWIGEAIWLSLAVFGLAFVAQTFHLAFVVVKWAGVAYLGYLAWKMWTRAGRECATAAMPRDGFAGGCSWPAWR